MQGSRSDEQPSALEVERRLVFHYLRAEGPCGTGPLTYIDASPDELTEALGAEPLPTLVRACATPSVSQVLCEGCQVEVQDATVPGYFRYLVLTCAVVATADENQETRDFRRNLAMTLGMSFAIPTPKQLPALWLALRQWVVAARECGEPIRELILPQPGVGKYIGLTNAIAFPGWRDLVGLRNWLAYHPTVASEIRKPVDVALRICPRIRRGERFSEQLFRAAEEYSEMYSRGTSMLHLHRLWDATLRALERPKHKRRSNSQGIVLELEFGLSASEVRLRVVPVRGDGAQDETRPSFNCKPDELGYTLTKYEGDAARQLRECVDAGAIPFVEQCLGMWTADLHSPAMGSRWRYLIAVAGAFADDRRIAALQHPVVPVGHGWSMIGPVDSSDALRLHQALNFKVDDGSAERDLLRIVGGFHTAHGWLGRTSVLPRLRREGTGRVYVVPEAHEGSQVEVFNSTVPAELRMFADRPLDGVYRVSLTEAAPNGLRLGIERRVRFVADAVQHPTLSGPDGRWVEQPEFRITTRKHRVWRGYNWPLPEADDRSSSPLDDLLEVVYARGQAGWSESDLVAVLRDLLPGPSPWDVLRSLQECGWLSRTTCSDWSATRWWLVAPKLARLQRCGEEVLVVEGSCPSTVLRRLEATVRALGGKLHTHFGVGPYAPATQRITGVDGAELGDEMGWKVDAFEPPVDASAPSCWPFDDLCETQHRHHQSWDWEKGCFGPPTDGSARRASVELERWKRHDRPDVFMVRKGRLSRAVSSRTVAIVEAYRLRRAPMYRLLGDRLERLPRQGHLPLPLAALCRMEALCAGGAVLVGDRWCYRYPAGPISTDAVRRCMGEAFLVDPLAQLAGDCQTRLPLVTRIARARHRGVRFYLPGAGARR